MGETDSSNCICPYCKFLYQVEGEDISDKERIEECYECGKNFHRVDEFSVEHITAKDCKINNEAHEYIQKPIGQGQTHGFCSKCGDTEPTRKR